jgi:hypothetical protein
MGWDVQVVRDASAHEQFENRVTAAGDLLAKQLQIDPEIALNLVKGGLNTLETIANGADASDISEMLGISMEEAEALQLKAVAKLGAGS